MSVHVAGDSPARPGGPVRRRRLPRPTAVPGIIGTAAAVIGLLDVVSAVFPAFRNGRMHALAALFPGTVSSLAAATSVVSGILLLMLAHALKRGKQRAWWAAVTLLPVAAASQLIYRHSIFGALVSLGLLALLVRHREQFTALSDPRTRWRAAVNFVVLSAFAFALGLVITSAHPAAESGDPGFTDRCRHVLFGLFGFEGPVRYTSDRVGDVVGYSLGGLGLLIACSTAYLVLRPARPVAELSAADEARLRGLLARHGARDSLGHFALRRDKSVVFSASGKAAVCYRVVSGVALASGDPIGDVEAWPGAIDRFMALARAHAWLPAVVGCSETGGEVWTRETALDALELGDEAIVDAAGFTLEGRAMRNVRQMVKRIERSGYVCRVRRVRELSEGERRRVRLAADAWRGTDTERGFSMALGRFGEDADGDCVVVTAHKERGPGDAHPELGDLRAVLHFVPWGADGMSLELMRRDRAADPGLNELLIVAALQQAPGLGVARVSLNFAMFRSALARGERIGAGPVLRGWRGLLVFLSRWFQIESLYKFNAKFRPEWVPRFLVFPNSRDLPRIGFAIMQAEGFVTLALPLPAALQRFLPGRAGRLAHRESCGYAAGTGGGGAAAPAQDPRTESVVA
ncbi:phosphatidylglycerol lysyltransferase domain-containing protein [Actinacidiphila sp. ITFR-21]|uniref:phosphatidylglycerol lysyltransferase domain-containing protein n=1 Tax=Actinacidiphila sp. ITFR-21 TaxID=3075199 RepID=UPI00288B1A7D|nr:phosphatidylglycerol lysyltransferase domain-containing protein [Streptomyces sp. ITFR-21]WNI16071.1 phosphatidylglycerol lysyltransferase domain-containing protein [Streptomyces sp. ITFR-21]